MLFETLPNLLVPLLLLPEPLRNKQLLNNKLLLDVDVVVVRQLVFFD
jgi:hypothetical protein